MLNHSGTTVSYDVQSFVKFGDHATDSAFPHADSPVPVRNSHTHGPIIHLTSTEAHV